MTTRLRLEPLPTPFAPGEDQITVATPSCCCCCCSCLISVATASSFAAAEAHHRAKEHDGNYPLALILGLLAGPLGLLALFLLLDSRNEVAAIFVPLIVVATMIWLALTVARTPQPDALGMAFIATVSLGGFAFLEFWIALVTALLIEFLAPLGIWAGIAMAKRPVPSSFEELRRDTLPQTPPRPERSPDENGPGDVPPDLL